MEIANQQSYYWMVRHTPQKEWIEGRGFWLWLAFVLGGMGGGLYLVSLYFDNTIGLVLGWLIVVALKGGAHLAYLGRPKRFWRAAFRWQTSWISRGILFVFGFGLFGAVQAAPAILNGLPWSEEIAIIKGLAVLFSFLVMIYPGFAMGYVKAIPFWNNAVLPLLFVSYGFLGGIGLFLPLAFAGGEGEGTVAALETGLRVMLAISALLLGLYLVGVNYSSGAARVSLRALLRGSLAAPFYLGVVISGVLLPLMVSWLSVVVGLTWPLLLVGLFGELGGSFALRYCLLKAGIYKPILLSVGQ